MLKDFTNIILTAKAVIDILKEKLESKTAEFTIQAKNFTDKTKNNSSGKAKEELSELMGEISHRAQINQLYLKGFIKDKLVELTNDVLLDSIELNDIRAEIASLRAEVADLNPKCNL